MNEMQTMTLKELATVMRDIDFAMLTTQSDDDSKAARPMSNNGEVEFGGDSYYFTWEHSRMARDILRDPQVGLTFQGINRILGKSPLFLAVEGRAEIVRDKTAFAAHWTRGLDRWFDQGVDTPGVVMLQVQAVRVKFWDGNEQAEVALER